MTLLIRLTRTAFRIADGFAAAVAPLWEPPPPRTNGTGCTQPPTTRKETTMTDLSCSPEDYQSPDAYAYAMAVVAANDPERHRWAIGGTSPDETPHAEVEFAIEPLRGDGPYMTDTELAGPIENLPSFAAGARIITRQITYGPWRYVTPDEIARAQ